MSNRPILNEDALNAEAETLREQATVIAISEAYTNTETLKAVAEPDRIVKVDLTQMTNSVINLICSPEAGNIFKSFLWE